MKKLLLLSTVMCMFSTVSFGMEVKPYIEGKISGNVMKSQYSEPGYGDEKFSDTVAGASVSVGLKMNQNYRVELEGYYNDSMEDNYLIFPVEFKTKGLFLNGYYDIDIPSTKKLKPFIGAGIGYSWMEEKINIIGFNLDGKDEDISYNIGLGFSYELNNNVDLSLGYRFEYLGEMEVGETKNEMKNNKISLGLRYTF